MPDREKVIKGLECCLKGDCSDCYQEGPGFGIECRRGVMRDALALLKEQEPVAPKVYYHGENATKMFSYSCGYCLHDIEKKYYFCPICGRKVKWNDQL